jgi:hypothetical protein
MTTLRKTCAACGASVDWADVGGHPVAVSWVPSLYLRRLPGPQGGSKVGMRDPAGLVELTEEAQPTTLVRHALICRGARV